MGQPRPEPVVRVRLGISYDGTQFAGWAIQPGQRTVCGELTAALTTLVGPSIRLTVAGRTDTGVHATGQVAHVDLPAEPAPDLDDLRRRLAGVLARDVRVRDLRVVPDEFDARFAALWRRYVYRITDAEWGAEPLDRTRILVWPRSLDVPAMHAAALGLRGLHDFAAFCRRRAGATTTREMQEIAVRREDALVTVTIQADAFCRSMVRSVVGALLAVGDGRRPPSWPVEMLSAGQRSGDVQVAAARGLTLVEVGYPADDRLADRALTTRTRRARVPS